MKNRIISGNIELDEFSNINNNPPVSEQNKLNKYEDLIRSANDDNNYVNVKISN